MLNLYNNLSAINQANFDAAHKMTVLSVDGAARMSQSYVKGVEATADHFIKTYGDLCKLMEEHLVGMTQFLKDANVKDKDEEKMDAESQSITSRQGGQKSRVKEVA